MLNCPSYAALVSWLHGFGSQCGISLKKEKEKEKGEWLILRVIIGEELHLFWILVRALIKLTRNTHG